MTAFYNFISQRMIELNQNFYVTLYELHRELSGSLYVHSLFRLTKLYPLNHSESQAKS